MTDPGKFVHLVYIYNPVQTLNAKGDMINVYSDTVPPVDGHEMRAALDPLLGRELVVAKGVRPDVTLKFRSWFTPIITPLSRIYWNNGFKWVRIDIASPVRPEYQNRELWFYGVELNG